MRAVYEGSHKETFDDQEAKTTKALADCEVAPGRLGDVCSGKAQSVKTNIRSQKK